MACHMYCWWSYGCITEPGPAVHMSGEELCCQHQVECAMTRPWQACNDMASKIGAQTELMTGRHLQSMAGRQPQGLMARHIICSNTNHRIGPVVMMLLHHITHLPRTS